jgi:bacterioferritin (cytochrome b1)
MPEHDELIQILNEAISLEYTAAVQYNQHSMLLTGRDRLLFEDLFEDSAKQSLEHAKMWGWSHRRLYARQSPAPAATTAPSPGS